MIDDNFQRNLEKTVKNAAAGIDLFCLQIEKGLQVIRDFYNGNPEIKALIDSYTEEENHE